MANFKGKTRPYKTNLLTFSIGLLIGFCLAYLFLNKTESNFYPISFQASSESALVTSLASLADEESKVKQVRILCWVLTNPKNHKSRGIPIKNTWGKRCTLLLFMSSTNDTELPAIGLPNVREGRNPLWGKTKEAFKYIYVNHFNDADWFMKADDDTYVVVENLQAFLSQHDSSKPIHFGCKYKPYTKRGYMAGGPGYVLSREALRKFVQGLSDSSKCKQEDTGAEDAEIGKCLEAMNVTAGDTRDTLGRFRFLPLSIESHLIPKPIDYDYWYYKNIFYPQVQGMDCCSNTAISFHYVNPGQMYSMEYFIYHVKPFGSVNNFSLADYSTPRPKLGETFKTVKNALNINKSMNISELENIAKNLNEMISLLKVAT